MSTDEIPPKEVDEKRRKRQQTISVYGTYGTMGFELAFSLVLPIVGGMYLDKRWDIIPWLTITGIFLGFATAFRVLMKYLKMMQKDNERPQPHTRSGSHDGYDDSDDS